MGANIGSGGATMRFDAHRADMIGGASFELVFIVNLFFGLTNRLKMNTFTITQVARTTIAHWFGRFQR